MAQKKYVSLTRLSNFLDNIKVKYSQVGHKHTISEITDYTVDTELSPTSTNPVANSALNEEFDAVSEAMSALELAIDNKSDSSHTHEISDINELQGILDSKSAVQIITWENDD